MKIGCSGQVNGRSGIGVMQRNLYSYLVNAGHELIFSQSRDRGTSATARAHGLVTGLRPAAGTFDVYLSTVPPLPFGVSAPTLTIVCDLRWQRTRSTLGRAYRSWELHRAVNLSSWILCISETTQRELIEFDPRACGKSDFQWLGPGQVQEVADDLFEEKNGGLLLLLGGAPHKRNEHAAAIIAQTRPQWVKGVVGVGVSAQVQSTLAGVYPCEWHHDVSDAEIAALFKRVEYFLMLGTDEGFGLPFIEALASGCQVIATDHPLAREVLGSAGVLVQPSTLAEEAAQLVDKPDAPRAGRLTQARKFSWKKFGEACEARLLEISR